MKAQSKCSVNICMKEGRKEWVNEWMSKLVNVLSRSSPSWAATCPSLVHFPVVKPCGVTGKEEKWPTGGVSACSTPRTRMLITEHFPCCAPGQCRVLSHNQWLSH